MVRLSEPDEPGKDRLLVDGAWQRSRRRAALDGEPSVPHGSPLFPHKLDCPPILNMEVSLKGLVYNKEFRFQLWSDKK